MKKINLILSIFLMSLFLILSASAVSAANATIKVNSSGSIQDAINSASSGDTIIVENGVFSEDLTIDKENLILMKMI